MPHTYTREEIQNQFIEVRSARGHRLFMTNAPSSAIRLVEEIPPDAGPDEAGEGPGPHRCVVVLNDGVESYINGMAEDFFDALLKSINYGFGLAQKLGEEQMKEIQAAQAEAEKAQRGRKGILVPRG